MKPLSDEEKVQFPSLVAESRNKYVRWHQGGSFAFCKPNAVSCDLCQPYFHQDFYFFLPKFPLVSNVYGRERMLRIVSPTYKKVEAVSLEIRVQLFVSSGKHELHRPLTQL